MSMEKPYAPTVTTPKSAIIPMPKMIPDISIHGINFDQLLNNKGIRVIHSRAIPCPNVTSLDSDSHDPQCTFCDNQGFTYYGEKEVFGVFTGNSLEKTFEGYGVWEMGSAVMTFPAEYSDGTQADFNTFDRLEVADFSIRLWEQIEYKPTTNFIQRLRYPILNIDYIFSIVNNTKVEYRENIDYKIVDSNIKWIGTKPYYNEDTGIGQVISIGYFARPVYVVVQTLRELRVTQEMQPNGIKIARRLPQEVLVKRDFLVNPSSRQNE